MFVNIIAEIGKDKTKIISQKDEKLAKFFNYDLGSFRYCNLKFK